MSAQQRTHCVSLVFSFGRGVANGTFEDDTFDPVRPAEGLKGHLLDFPEFLDFLDFLDFLNFPDFLDFLDFLYFLDFLDFLDFLESFLMLQLVVAVQ